MRGGAEPPSETKVGRHPAVVVPTFSGEAWITGFAHYVVDPRCPLPGRLHGRRHLVTLAIATLLTDHWARLPARLGCELALPIIT
jgi:hypothetical protein